MTKRFRWVFLAMLVVVAIVWAVVAEVGNHESKGGVAEDVAEQNPGRESSRHRTGEVEKNLPTPLEKKVGQLELQLADKRKVLVELAKAKAPVHMNIDGTPPPEVSPEEAAKRAQAVVDFDHARREYQTDLKSLQELKLALAEEQAKGK